MVKNYLGEFGFCVTAAHSGGAGISLYRRERFDALILDLMLPDMDGLEVCRQIRADAQARILMLTARGDAMDRVVGLEMGAEDRKSTRLNSSHRCISYAVFCLKK